MSTLFDRTVVRKIVIHHLGNRRGPLATKEELLTAANPHNYEYPEYDYGILADGSIVAMRPLSFIGAHAIADRLFYKDYGGKNWWNRHSASVVMACDCEQFAPPVLQVAGLIRFLTEWLKDRGLTMDDAYPHFQITATKCPGATYKKLGLATGFLDYDYVERVVTHNLEDKEESGLKLIIAYTEADLPAALILADFVQGAVILARNTQPWDLSRFSIVFQVGGPTLKSKTTVLLSGIDRYATAKKVIEYIVLP